MLYGVRHTKNLNDPQIIALLKGDNAQKLTLAGAYTRQGWLRRCVSLRAQTLASIPWVICRCDGDPANADDVLWTSGEMAPPELKAIANLPVLLPLLEASMALKNQSYIYKHRANGGLDRLQFLSPVTIEPALVGDPRTNMRGTAGTDIGRSIEKEIRERTGVAHFWRTVGTTQKIVSTLDMVWAFGPDPFVEAGPGRGSDGYTALDAANVLNSMDSFLSKYFDRGLIKATLLTVPQGTHKDERQRVQAWWRRWFSGSAGAHDQKVIEADGIKPVVVGEGLKDLSNTDVTTEQREAIATDMQIPISLLMSSAANFAVKESDVEDFYRFTMIPNANTQARSLNALCLNELGVHIHFQPEKIEVFREQELQRAGTITKLVGRPVLTVEEGRTMMGLPAEPEAGELYTPPTAATQTTARSIGKHERAELRDWKRKAARKGPDVKFDCRYLDEQTQIAIRTRLALGDSLDTAFSPPF